MGRKGGGRSGFVKSARSARPGNEENASAAEAAPAAAPPAAAPAAGAPPQPAFSKKAATFLNNASDDGDSSGDDEGDAGAVTRGKVLQRHKKEQKALKEQAKRLGKKGKDEAAKLEADLALRHAAELAALDGAKKRTVSEAVAVADSLYSVSLSGEAKQETDNKKQSKSQRRRQQRQLEDEEREARIQAELLEMGDTDRMVEDKELKAILRPLGLVVHEIPPDGHCLYRSLEDQLQRLPAEVAPQLAAEGEQEEELSFLLLRQKAADYMRQHAEEFKPFVLEEDATTSGGGGGDDAFEVYCTEMESTPAWGGQVEIQALAHALKSHIVVYTVGMPAVEMGEEYKGTGRTLRLCYLRHAYGLGEHYESVVPGLVVVDEDEEAEEALQEAVQEDQTAETADEQRVQP